jgi:chromosome segregation ATPase
MTKKATGTDIVRKIRQLQDRISVLEARIIEKNRELNKSDKLVKELLDKVNELSAKAKKQGKKNRKLKGSLRLEETISDRQSGVVQGLEMAQEATLDLLKQMFGEVLDELLIRADGSKAFFARIRAAKNPAAAPEKAN